MDFSTSMNISASGLSVQRKRMEAISSNLANIDTTRTEEGGPYRRKDVVVTALPIDDHFGLHLKNEMKEHVKQVVVTDVIEDQNEPKMEYNPDHPDANELGYVAKPNINLMSEMVNLLTASRAYEANVTAINAAKSMALRAVDIGR